MNDSRLSVVMIRHCEPDYAKDCLTSLGVAHAVKMAIQYGNDDYDHV